MSRFPVADSSVTTPWVGRGRRLVAPSIVSQKYLDLILCAALPLPGISASFKLVAEGWKVDDAFSECDWREGAVFSRFVYGGNPWPRAKSRGTEGGGRTPP